VIIYTEKERTGDLIMKFKGCLSLFVVLCILLFLHSFGYSGQEKISPAPPSQQNLALAEAVMCESLRDHVPSNQGIVFPLRCGKVYCFTEFDPVPKKTAIYHNWYYRGKLSTRVKLNLQPPRWATYSAINLEETDKGPWQVEITDQEGLVLGIVRFSITD
jgi:hypothetical protein